MISSIPPAVATTAGPAGAAGPDEDQVILRDGSAIVVRPLATGDIAAIASWFEGLGPETRHARFLGGVAVLSSRTRSLLAQVDHRDHEALTAVTPKPRRDRAAYPAAAVLHGGGGGGRGRPLARAGHRHPAPGSDRGAGSRGGHRLPDRPVPCLEHRRPGPSPPRPRNDNHPTGSGGHRGTDQPGAAQLEGGPRRYHQFPVRDGHPGLDIQITGITRPSASRVNSGSSPPAAAMITGSESGLQLTALRAAASSTPRPRVVRRRHSTLKPPAIVISEGPWKQASRGGSRAGRNSIARPGPDLSDVLLKQWNERPDSPATVTMSPGQIARSTAAYASLPVLGILHTSHLDQRRGRLNGRLNPLTGNFTSSHASTACPFGAQPGAGQPCKRSGSVRRASLTLDLALDLGLRNRLVPEDKQGVRRQE